jgi:glycerophosphoryl diester phosphodiesterase
MNDWPLPFSTAFPLPFWIAHRGAGKLAPENTLAAFRLGAQFGYRAFECDVKLSRDGLPFLLHDDDLDRTTNASGPADALNWSELAGLDAGSWHSRHFAGEPPASLAAVARFVIANRLALNLELKPNPGQARLTGQVVGREVLRLWQDCPSPPLLSSFDVAALEGAQDAAPSLPRGLLLEHLHAGWLAQAQALGCCAVITHYPLMQPHIVEQIHAVGLKALVYTVNDAATAQALQASGVDGVITDSVDKFAPAEFAL